MKTNFINRHFEYSKYAVFLFATVYLSSCNFISDPGDLEDISSATTIHIDPMHLSSEVTSAGQVFDSVCFIPLETNSSSRFSKIDQLEILKNNFIILDKSSNSILTFNREGKFISKITGTYLHQFAVDYHNGYIVFPDYSDRQTYTYNLLGKLVNVKPTPLYHISCAYIGDNTIAYYRAYISNKVRENDFKTLEPENLIISDSTFNKTAGFFRFEEDKVLAKEIYSPPKTFYRTAAKTVFIHPYNYYVYDISSGKPKADYQLVFPTENMLPKNFLSSSDYYGTRMEYVKKNLNRIFDIQNFYEVKDFLSFRLRTANYSDCFLYNKKTKKLISILDLASDEMSNLVPLGDEVLAADSNSVFTSITSKSLLSSRWLSTSEISDEKLPTALKIFFTSGSNLNNPIIIQCFLK